MELAVACYELTKSFPREEIYGMTSQVRRAAAAVPANVAEGYGRENPGEFVQFLRMAQGSLKELETHLLLASRVELTKSQTIAPVLGQCETVGKMLRALIRSIQKRRGSGGRETVNRGKDDSRFTTLDSRAPKRADYQE
ncbi:MAG: four helix bundle protein [Rubrobacter sp.]|nr:four helix bundle protein [Rubrobacter sp.]